MWIGRCWCIQSLLLKSYHLPPFLPFVLYLLLLDPLSLTSFGLMVWAANRRIRLQRSYSLAFHGLTYRRTWPARCFQKHHSLGCLFLFFSCWFSMMWPPDASACRTATCSSSLTPSSSGTSPAPRSIRALLISRTLLSLSDSVLACFPPGFSRQDSCSDSLSESSPLLPATFCNAFPGQLSMCPRASISVDKTWSLPRSTSRGFSTTILGNLNTVPSSSTVTFFVNFKFWNHHLLTSCQFCFCDHCVRPSHHVPRVSKTNFQIHRFPGITQSLTYPTVASHTSILGNIQNCSLPILVTNKGSLNPSFQSWVDTFFSNSFETKSSFRIVPTDGEIQFSACSRIALQNEESNWVTKLHLWFSHLCCVSAEILRILHCLFKMFCCPSLILHLGNLHRKTCLDKSEFETCPTQENADKDRVCLFFLFFLQRFHLNHILNTTAFNTNCTPIPVNSMSTIFSFLFCSSYGILWVRFNCGEVLVPKIFSSSSTSVRDSPTGSMT